MHSIRKHITSATSWIWSRMFSGHGCLLICPFYNTNGGMAYMKQAFIDVIKRPHLIGTIAHILNKAQAFWQTKATATWFNHEMRSRLQRASQANSRRHSRPNFEFFESLHSQARSEGTKNIILGTIHSPRCHGRKSACRRNGRE